MPLLSKPQERHISLIVTKSQNRIFLPVSLYLPQTPPPTCPGHTIVPLGYRAPYVLL